MITSKQILSILEDSGDVIARNIVKSLLLIGLQSKVEVQPLITPSGKFTQVIIMASMGGQGFTLYGNTTGVGISICSQFKRAEFLKINSTEFGMGLKMVDAVISNVPSDWSFYVDRDWSQGWWPKVKSKYSSRKWIN